MIDPDGSHEPASERRTEGDDPDHGPASGGGSRRRHRRATRPPEGGTDAPLSPTTDDTDEGWGESRDESAQDRWLREQRPPHWS